MLHVDKVDSLITEKITITADRLEPWKNYKFQLIMHNASGTYMSYCVIKADSLGRIDLARDAPLRGGYYEADAMGLFLSLAPTDDVPIAAIIRTSLKEPSYYTLKLFSQSEKLLEAVHLKKHWMHPNVTVEVFDEDGFYGVLYRPPGKGPFPCIINIPAASGFLPQFTPMLASRGYMVFTFLYYSLTQKGLPRQIMDVDSEYFAKPIEFVENLPYCSGKIGIFSNCFGGTISLHLASKFPQISVVVLVNPLRVFSKDELVIKENGQQIYSNQRDTTAFEYINGFEIQKPSFEKLHAELTPETDFKWGDIPKTTSFRIVGGLDDLVNNNPLCCYNIQRHLIETGHKVELDILPGGHNLMPPYFPLHFIYELETAMMACGGDTVLHTKSQETSWEKNMNFFIENLGAPAAMPDWSRDTKVVLPNLSSSKL